MTFPIAASIPYILYFLFLIIVSGSKKFQSESQIFLLLLATSLLVFLSYHGEYSDWRTYKSYAETCTSIGCTYFEPFYDFITFVASQTVGFYLIPFISLVLIFMNFNLIKKYTKNNTEYFILTLSIFLVFLPLYYGALRQSRSFSFLLISFFYFFDKKYVKSLLFVIVAIGFHLSAIVISLVFIIYFYIWKISKENYKNFIFLLLVSYLSGIYLMQIFANEMAMIDSFNPGTLNATVDTTKSLLLPVERIIILIMGLYILYYFKEDKLFLYVSLFSITGALFYLIVYQYSLNTAGRVVAFYRFADVFIIYYFFKTLFSRNKYPINTNNINGIAIFSILLYSLIKYYFTIVSVGFFQ